jgi:hypothetical protein
VHRLKSFTLMLLVMGSPVQSLAIVTAHAKAPMIIDSKDLPMWRTAMSLLKLQGRVNSHD